MSIEATVICDSISKEGKRLTTFKLRYPKFIHGEFMTHRLLSRNASSSRAIPTSKLIAEVRSHDDRARPVFWGKNQKGMQAAEELSDVEGHPDGPRSDRWKAQCFWNQAAIAAADYAELLNKLGAHKQIVNRLLEPFSHINVVATATEWGNFFGLRLHPDAQPEMRALAQAMWKGYQDHEPTKLNPDDWHLPFYCSIQDEQLFRRSFIGHKFDREHHIDLCRKVSTARCARVSYESNETLKRSSVEEDLVLYDRLLSAQPLHASPAEHQATPDTYDIPAINDDMTDVCRKIWRNPREHGNFVGWRQYRKMLPGESCAPLPKGYSL